MTKRVKNKPDRVDLTSLISFPAEQIVTPDILTEICPTKEINSLDSSVRSLFEQTDAKPSIRTQDIDEAIFRPEKEMFIQELSYKLNELQDSFSQHRDPVSLLEREKPLVLNDVKITPGTMIFKDAYDGKRFNQTLTITNCGKHSVSVRIFPPTSKAFKIKKVPVGHTLSAGLSLVRQIKYLYTKPTAIPQACMDIYVNNCCIRYELLVITCYTQISVSPKILDFGEIDIGMVSDLKILTITNSGTKQAQYSIDLGRNQMEIIVQPLKGTVQPGEFKEITVEIFGTTPGEFQQEFWIKTDPLQRVHIQGNFIEPSLKSDYPLRDRNFFILYFPKTFVGVRQQKNVVIRNHSSTSAVFCVMGRTKDEKLPLRDVKEMDINYKQFYINPMEGRLHSDQQYIMGITFVPQKPKHRPDYYICSVIVDVKKCRVGNAPKSKSAIKNEDKKLLLTYFYFLETYPETQTVNNCPLLDSISITTLDEQNEPEQEVMSLNDMITILLYGEVEVPEITLEPQKLYLNNLKVSELHEQPLKIVNNSKTLPLFIKYNKIANIEVEPKTIHLPPRQAVNAVIRLKPTRMGDTSAQVSFEILYRQYEQINNLGTVGLELFYSAQYPDHLKLLKKRKAYFVPGITPLVTNEVGYQVDDVRFNTRIEKPKQAIVDEKYLVFNKKNDALIAFPNDRPKCLRPWRNNLPCNTIFAQLPRIVTAYESDYDLNPKEKLLQETNQSYYKAYIKSLALNKQPRTFEDTLENYVTTNEKLILMQNLKNFDECPSVLKNLNKHSLFVPLTPYQLHNLIVAPKFIQLGRLAAHTECSNHFNIENKNDLPVHVSIKAQYPSITVHKDQFILAPKTQKNINFTYHSDSSGTHHIPMFVILNFFHVFDVTVLANIVSNTVKCVTKDICIVPTEKTAFLELRNPINSDVKFTIDTTFFHLESFPSSGVIPAKRNMTCTITFNPEVGYMPVKEIAVVSESGAKELVEVHFDHKKAVIALSTETLDFGDVPLNTLVSKELTIKNNSDQLVPVNIEIENAELFPEIEINPRHALLWQKGDIVITFSLKFKQVVQFTLPIKLIFQYEYPRKIVVSGSVVFPEVSFKPGLIKIQKIPSGSVVKTPFKISNLTQVTNFLSFPLQDFPEFNIKTKNGENVNDGLTIGPKEKKDLCLEFHPQEPVAYCIYLPYILNGILGPPELNRSDSLKCSEYLPLVKNMYKTSPDILSSKLTVMKILCAAGKKWLQFSCLEMSFCSFNKTKQDFEVKNICSAIHEITFKLKQSDSFTLTPSNYNMAMVDDNFTTILSPEDTFTITIEFKPGDDYGTCTMDIPIFVKDYSDTVPFNCLYLTGSNPAPRMSPCMTDCYFLPTHIESRLEKTIKLELIAHTCNGDVELSGGDSHIFMWFFRKENVSEMKMLLYYTVMFEPKAECNIETKIKFTCPCPASAEVEVFACSDSSLLINFMAAPDIRDHATFPYYPLDDDTSPYAVLMRSIVPIIERWLYSQGFMYENYYKIPDDISRYPVNTDGDKKKNFAGKKKYALLPLVQLLVNLMDGSILKYIDNGINPTEDLNGRTLYNYVTYRNTISFLKSQGIFVPGLKPEHLLPYVEYVEYKKSFVDKERDPSNESFTGDEFYRFSKQRWLDLFFRVYKVLVLQRVVDPKPMKSSSSKQCEFFDSEFITSDKRDFEKYFKKKVKRFTNWFSCEAKLLLWLEYHYNRQKKVLWPDEVFEKDQSFSDFSNIDDSVALATVTAAYCPYLTEQLRDTYASPKKLEHRIHNACRVVQVWKSLKLSFDIHPHTIVTGNRIKIVCIVTYLYEVLPHYYPTDDIRIEAPLSESVSYELSISNCGDDPIKYLAIFFGESSELFDLDNYQIVIPSKKTRKIKLTYFAKKVFQASSILVLSGEASGQKYAKSMAVTIAGIPKTSECEEIEIQVETYKQLTQKINLQTPYAKSYTAKIFTCFEEPKSYKDFHAVSTLKAMNIPREVSVAQNDCDFVEKGEASITLQMCFLSQGLISFYLYFCNDKIGDFCVLVKITSTTTKKQTAQELPVVMSNAFRKRCTCKRIFNKNCPKAIRVDIPSRNTSLWSSTHLMVESCINDASTIQLMKKYFGTPLIFRLLKFYLERFPEGFMLPSCIFEDQADYVISPNKRYSTPTPTFTIRDVTSEDSVPLMLHWEEDGIPTEEYLEMMNTNGKEVRYFKLVFPKLKMSSVDVLGSIEESKTSVASSMSKKGL